MCSIPAEIKNSDFCRDRVSGICMSLYFIKSRIAFLGTRPTEVLYTLPFLNAIRVGMLIMLNFEASSGCSSTFTLHNFTSVVSLESSSIAGERRLHGPHQSAQKSIMTGCAELITSDSKF